MKRYVIDKRLKSYCNGLSQQNIYENHYYCKTRVDINKIYYKMQIIENTYLFSDVTESFCR